MSGLQEKDSGTHLPMAPQDNGQEVLPVLHGERPCGTQSSGSESAEVRSKATIIVETTLRLNA